MNKNSQDTMTDARPTHEQISIRAELLWKAQGSPSGRDEEIWLEAERQLFEEAREMLGAASASTPRGEPNPERSETQPAAEQMNSKRPTAGSSRRRSASGR